MQYWRSTSQFEVDLVIDGHVAVEIKATDHVMDKHLKGLRALKEEGQFPCYIVVSCDPEIRRTEDGIIIYPWREFLSALWSGRIL